MQTRQGRFFLYIFSCGPQLYKRLSLSIGPSVSLSVHPSVLPYVRDSRVEMSRNKYFKYFLCMFECGVRVGVWMGVECPCPTVDNAIVTPRHLLIESNFGGLADRFKYLNRKMEAVADSAIVSI